MSDSFSYPKILLPGGLLRLNTRIIDLLGVPLVFSAPDLPHPRADTATGALYEAVTGLYIVYHDYGIEMLTEYLAFCRKHLPGVGYSQTDGTALDRHPVKTRHTLVADRLDFHRKDVSTLRSALCHGSLENGVYARDIMRVIGHYEDNSRPIRGQWPNAIAELTAEQCADILKKLTADADLMGEYLLNCAAAIAADPVGLLTDWRNTLADTVFSDKPKKTQKSDDATDADEQERYFNERIIWDVKASIVNNAREKGHQTVVKNWLTSIRPKLQNGGYTSEKPEELAESLFAAIQNHFCPLATNTQSAAKTLLGDLFADLLSADDE